MGHLTDDMTRLCEEIKSMHKARREGLSQVRRRVAQLKDNAKKMLTDFKNTHAEMSKKGKAERALCISSLRESVLTLRKSVLNLKKGAALMRQKFAADLSGAHQAWFGSPSPKIKPRPAENRYKEKKQEKEEEKKQ